MAGRAEICSCLAGHGLLLEDPAGATSPAELPPRGAHVLPAWVPLLRELLDG